MLTLSHPHSIDASFEDTYHYLIGMLERLCGYPLTIERDSERIAAEPTPQRLPDGSIRFPLPSSRKGTMHWRLMIPPEAAADKQCTRIVAKFVTGCKRMAGEIKQVSDLKEYLIRNSAFLWDDLVMSLTHQGGQKYNALELLGALRESLLFRYEEKPVRLGVLMTWNWHSTGEVLMGMGCKYLKARRQEDIHEALRTSKALNWLADGEDTLLLVTPAGKIAGLLSVSALAESATGADWGMVPQRFRHLNSLLLGRDIVCTTTEAGELYLFRKESVLKWTHQGWYRVSGPGIVGLLSAHTTPQAAAVLSDVAVEMSFQKRGGLIAIVGNAEDISEGASPGVAAFFSSDPLLEANPDDLPVILRLASLDGALIVDSHGLIRNAGVILRVPGAHTSAGEGARSAAASYASTHGLAIKISQDGPISIYEDGNLVRLL
ncbi:MAG: hypothetical protein ACK5AZ_04445 [Bryobacteraceae bacterium]